MLNVLFLNVIKLSDFFNSAINLQELNQRLYINCLGKCVMYTTFWLRDIAEPAVPNLAIPQNFATGP